MWARALLTFALVCVTVSVGVAQTSQSFDAWLADLLAEARARGYTEEVLAQTLVGLTPLPGVIASDRKQAEVVLTFEEYLQRRVTPAIVQRGRELLAEHGELLARIRDAYGVPPPVIIAIWAMETRFGQHRGDVPVFQALATLAWEARRAALFRAQLYDALAMVHRGHIDARSMTGSWAGAMGHPQFMPSSYLAYAVDFDGDGRRDIWESLADTFASIANYLAKNGWSADGRWGQEVRVTPAVAKTAVRRLGRRGSGCRAMRAMIGPARLVEWQRLGVRGDDGGALPSDAPRAALVPAGTRSFLVHGNYDALLRYNCAHHYALTVALLADRLD